MLALRKLTIKYNTILKELLVWWGNRGHLACGTFWTPEWMFLHSVLLNTICDREEGKGVLREHTHKKREYTECTVYLYVSFPIYCGFYRWFMTAYWAYCSKDPIGASAMIAFCPILLPHALRWSHTTNIACTCYGVVMDQSYITMQKQSMSKGVHYTKRSS